MNGFVFTRVDKYFHTHSHTVGCVQSPGLYTSFLRCPLSYFSAALVLCLYLCCPGTVFATSIQREIAREKYLLSVFYSSKRGKCCVFICNHKCRERDGIPFYSFHPCFLYLVSVVVNWDRSAAPNLLLFKSRH
jgi:hypothetical protein